MYRKCLQLASSRFLAGNVEILAPNVFHLKVKGELCSPYHSGVLSRTNIQSNQRTNVRFMGKQSKGSSMKKSNKLVDTLIDSIEEEEENQEERINVENSELNKFLSSKSTGGPKKGSKGSTVHKMKYTEFTQIVEGERLWSNMAGCVDALKKYYIQQLTVRSTTSLDELAVDLDGDVYPLNELANISKKDPKRLIIDSSAFPQATKNIMTAITNSGMNLNPQQDGHTIYVPIPKVTKEHRENLVEGAKKKFTECKTDLRKIQNTYQRKVGEDELASKVTKDDAKDAQETVRLLADHFTAQAEQMLNTKTKELLGK